MKFRTTNACTTAVLIVLPWSPSLPGGVSVVVRNLLDHWDHKGIEARAVVSAWNASQLSADVEGDTCFRFSLIGAHTRLGLTKALVGAPTRLWRTWRLLRRYHVSAVNFHYPSLDALGVAMLRRLGLFKGQLVLSFHGTDVRAPLTPLEAQLWRWLFHMSSAITACSKTLAKEVALAYGRPVEAVTAIYNGVDTALFHPNASSASDRGMVPAEPYVVSIGSYIPRKGHRLLLDAFAEVAAQRQGLHLVIIGMDGPERAALLAQAKSLGLGDLVTLMVNLKPAQVAAVVVGAAICVQPSTAEPFGLAVIEAGACGVPVLASAVGGHVELITEGQNGCLFAAGDVVQCAEKIRYMLMNGDASGNMAERFRSEIQLKYTWQVCAEAYLQKLGWMATGNP